MIKTIIAGLIVSTAAIGGVASAQTSSLTLGHIKAAKAINVAFSTDSFPFSVNGPNNERVGYSIALCKRAIAQIGRTVGEPTLKVDWLADTVTERLQMVATGRADLECANTTQALARLANVDFFNLVFIDGGGFLVKTGAPINQSSYLAGKKMPALMDTTTETRLNDALHTRSVNATVVQLADASAGVAMLEAGTVDAHAGDKVQLIGLAVQAKTRPGWRW